MSNNTRTDEKFKSLEIATDYVEQHFGTRYLFPIKPGAKFPPLIKDNLDKASNDPAKLREWVEKFGAVNWGVAHKKSKLLVADVDTNEAKGKVGRATFDDLDLMYGWPETETTITPTGGFHKIYEGWADDQHPEFIMALGENGIGKDIDSPNYTLIPGCKLDKGGEYVGNGATAVACPKWIYDTIKTSKSKSRVTDAGEVVIELDKPENVEQMIEYLKLDAEPSISGSGGDFNLLKAALYLKDFGISQQLGAQLLNEYFNPRCEPAWEMVDLEKKMASAYAYGNLSKVGGKTAEADFADEPDEAPIVPMGIYDIETGEYKPPNVKEIARKKADRAKKVPKGATEGDFTHYGPTNTYVFKPTRDMWPAGSINALFGGGAAKRIAVGSGVQQATWAPGLPMIIRDKIVSNGTWIDKPGASVLNLYRPPLVSKLGDAAKAGPWLDHIKRVYPDDWQHIVGWFAWRVQRPDVKINHCLVFGGDPGIGKDTIIAGLRNAVGAWNCSECNPANLLGEYTAGLLQAVILRVNEARDMGEGRINRYDFYEGTKTMMADPPETLKVQAKYLNWYDIMNLVGPIITTNNKTNGLYLPPDDRRHFIAWSKLTEADFADAALTDPAEIKAAIAAYFGALWDWYRAKDDSGATGFDHVAAYLRGYDLTTFDPKATPPKTSAFWEIVGANRAPEESELAGLLMTMGDELGLGEPSLPEAITLEQVTAAAGRNLEDYDDLYGWLTDRKQRRAMAARFEKAGYAMTRNPGKGSDGLWRVAGKRQTVYTLRTLSGRDAFKAVTALQRDAERRAARDKVSRAAADRISDQGGRNALN